MDAALKFVDAGKRFGKAAVFGNLDLRIECGSFFGLAGVNGAGKTTLMKCLLDFCTLDSGRMEIFGLSHLEARSRARLAYLPERFNPPYYLKGKDFLDCSLKLYGTGAAPAAITGMLDELDLDRDALECRVRSLSKGMTQKLGLAAVFLSGKDLLVLDEPMSGLDPKARAIVKSKLVNMKCEGKTLFFTSHSLADMEELCDRMAVLHGGRLKFIGTPGLLRKLSAENDLEQGFLRCIGDR